MAHLTVHACAGKKSPCCRDSVPNRRTLVSSCRFPPLREGNRARSVPPGGRGNLKEGGHQLLSCVDSGSAIGIVRPLKIPPCPRR